MFENVRVLRPTSLRAAGLYDALIRLKRVKAENHHSLHPRLKY